MTRSHSILRGLFPIGYQISISLEKPPFVDRGV